MRVNEEGKKLKDSKDSISEKEEVVKKYNPRKDILSQWFAITTSINYARSKPQISICSRVLSRLHRRAVPKEVCPMMAVTIRNYRHVLMYNEEWLQKASFSEITATMVHEAYHILLKDVPRFFKRMKMFPKEQRGSIHHLMNVALDAANNDLIKDRMPHMKYGGTGYWVLPENMDLPLQESSEVYFEILLERAKKNSEKLKDIIQKMKGSGKAKDQKTGEAMENLDDQNAHDWSNSDDSDDSDDSAQGKGQGPGGENPFGVDIDSMSDEEIEALATQLEEEAKRQTVRAIKDHQKSCGSVPNNMKQKLKELLSEGEISWTDFLRNLVSSRICSEKLKTPNRFKKNLFIYAEEDEEGRIQPRLDFPLPTFPGVKEDKTFVILWALDTSGSMNESEVQEGLEELLGLTRHDPNIHVITVQCDTRISDVTVVSPDFSVEEYVEEVGRTSYGGTSFDPPFELVDYIVGNREEIPVPDKFKQDVGEKLHEYDNVDMVIYHTDGEAYMVPPELQPQCPTLWCMSNRARSKPGMGKHEFFGQVIWRN